MQEHNVYAVYNNPSAEERRGALDEMDAAVNVAFVCFALDFFGMFTGASLFNNKVNLLQIMAHFIGGVLVSTFLHDSWDFTALW